MPPESLPRRLEAPSSAHPGGEEGVRRVLCCPSLASVRWPAEKGAQERSAPLSEGPASAESRTFSRRWAGGHCGDRQSGRRAAPDGRSHVYCACATDTVLWSARRRRGGRNAARRRPPPVPAWPRAPGRHRPACSPVRVQHVRGRGRRAQPEPRVHGPKLVLEHRARDSPIALWNSSIRESEAVSGATSLPPHTSSERETEAQEGEGLCRTTQRRWPTGLAASQALAANAQTLAPHPRPGAPGSRSGCTL